MAIFTPRVLGKSEVSGIPVEELLEAEMAYFFPESEQEQVEEIDGRLVELEERFECDENEGYEKRNERFANCRQIDGAQDAKTWRQDWARVVDKNK